MTGKPVFSKLVVVRIKPRTYERLIKVADCRGENVSIVIRAAIKAELDYSENMGEVKE